MWLFSASGNALVASFLAQKLQEKSGFSWEVRKFSLTPSQFSLDFSAQDGHLELFVNGTYSLLVKHLEGTFLLHSKGFFSPFNILSKKVSLNIADNTWIEGNFKGDFSRYFIQANSNLIKANNDLHAQFSYLTLQNYTLSIKEASFQNLLITLNKTPYSDGILNAKLEMFQNSDSSFDGKITLNIDGGDLDRTIFLESLGLKIPPTHFLLQLQGKIAQNSLNYTFNLYSSVGDMMLKGVSNLHSLMTQANFYLKSQTLSSLSPFFNTALKGSLNANGTIDGNTQDMFVQAQASIENSPLDFQLHLRDFKPYILELKSENLEIKSLLHSLINPRFYKEH